jgi:hypothetical protein
MRRLESRSGKQLPVARHELHALCAQMAFHAKNRREKRRQ